MERYKTFLTALFEKIEFPQTARQVMLGALVKAWSEEFKTLLKIYDESSDIDYGALTERMKKLSQKTGLHEYEGSLLLFLCLALRLEKYYHERGYSQKMFDDIIKDLCYKMRECYTLYGVWGTFTASWHWAIFRFSLFAFGKLQFAPQPFQTTYQGQGMELTPESLIVYVHIPNTGSPLTREDKEQAYREAKEFFQPLFGAGNKIPFVTRTWLLFPRNKEFLKPTSNLYAFIEDFDIFDVIEYSDYAETWRLFGKPFTRWEDMPQDTSLQRAYIELIKRGEKTGKGHGVFFL